MTKFYEVETLNGTTVILAPAHISDFTVQAGVSATVFMASGNAYNLDLGSFVNMAQQAKLEMFLYATEQTADVNFNDLPDHDVEDLVEGA